MLLGEKRNGLLEDLGAVMGTEATLRLIAVFGGASLYVPQRATNEHPISWVVGKAPFVRLVEAFGGDVLSLPDNSDYERLRRWRRVVRLLAKGATVADVATTFQVTERTVRNIRRQAELCGVNGNDLPPG
ncbi:hypothetical protein GO613_01305 [Azoarcus communis]|uniref:helix-turn-helix domain-containing protein n=1 Tax=Parazoarcus communis TaxID=41977 RepID=UPI0014597E83|nr:helix-turn-helix domain-containing protein [Parazoarcus communis]NMG46746.1 hypothetical protein [Parazoarcus communis]